MACLFVLLRHGYYVSVLFTILTLSLGVNAADQGWKGRTRLAKVCDGDRIHLTQLCPLISQNAPVLQVTIGYRVDPKQASTNQNLIFPDAQRYVGSGLNLSTAHLASGNYWCNITLSDAENSNRTVSGTFRLQLVSCRPTSVVPVLAEGCHSPSQVMDNYYVKDGDSAILCWHIEQATSIHIYAPNGSVLFNTTAFHAVVSQSLATRLTPVGSKTNHSSDSGSIGISLHHATASDAGNYAVIKDGVTTNTTTLAVIGWIKTVRDFSVKEKTTASFNWTYDDRFVKADSVTIDRVDGRDSYTLFEVTPKEVYSNDARLSFLGNAIFTLSTVNLSDSGTYRCKVKFVVPYSDNRAFYLEDTVQLTVTPVVATEESKVDYPLVTGLFILILVLLIPVGICFHICCAKGKTSATLNPVNMHHGVYQDASRGSSNLNLSTEIDPMLLHARILALRRTGVRSRTVSEATVATANDLWFGHNREPSVTPNGRKTPNRIHFDAVKEESQSV